MNKPSTPFEPFPKIPRLNRDVTITEKIDGTNAGILVVPEGSDMTPEERERYPFLSGLSVAQQPLPGVYASSRKRWITPENDNFGFARWVEENAATLATDLGPGMHFGEWWGAGIQRRYGQDHKRFSLFNTTRWMSEDESGRAVADNFETPRLTVVPVLYEGPFNDVEIDGSQPWDRALSRLRTYGSVAAPGFMNPEGIIVFHSAAGHGFKVTLKGDEKPKGAK